MESGVHNEWKVLQSMNFILHPLHKLSTDGGTNRALQLMWLTTILSKCCTAPTHSVNMRSYKNEAMTDMELVRPSTYLRMCVHVCMHTYVCDNVCVRVLVCGSMLCESFVCVTVCAYVYLHTHKIWRHTLLYAHVGLYLMNCQELSRLSAHRTQQCRLLHTRKVFSNDHLTFLHSSNWYRKQIAK